MLNVMNPTVSNLIGIPRETVFKHVRSSLPSLIHQEFQSSVAFSIELHDIDDNL